MECRLYINSAGRRLESQVEERWFVVHVFGTVMKKLEYRKIGHQIHAKGL
jgi:hypothetical protein